MHHFCEISCALIESRYTYYSGLHLYEEVVLGPLSPGAYLAPYFRDLGKGEHLTANGVKSCN